eukprot:TRINITY_DN4671_c0_g1_i1.p2 TRINITY_DN4671_c0_g1~~TRINITY_DN4671_c0_g1_i1.p2  ORF type:complete len:101 (-),score=10.17 TRINITY_DN4671_c0_g1_i1:126-428(-)
MCIPRITPVTGSLLVNVSALTKLTKISVSNPAIRHGLFNNSRQRQFSTMKCGPKTEMRSSSNTMSSLSCPAITYISILSLFTYMVIMNNIHSTDRVHKIK